MKRKPSDYTNVAPLGSGTANGILDDSRRLVLANNLSLSVRTVRTDAIVPLTAHRGRRSNIYQPLIDALGGLELGQSLELTLEYKRLKNVVSQVRKRAEDARNDGSVLVCVRTGENTVALSFEASAREQKKGVEGAKQSVETVTKRYGAIRHESID